MQMPEVVRVYQRWPSWVGEPSPLEEALTAFDVLAQDASDDSQAVTKLTVAIAEPLRAPCVAT